MQRLRRARWAALRRAGSRRKRTFRRSLISPADGSTAFMVAVRRGVSCSTFAFYNKRGTCEQWIKEGKGAIGWTRLSCRLFAANAVRLQLHALAYNLGNFLRTLATPEPIQDWSLTSLKEKLIKIGAKIVSHGRDVAFQMAVARRLDPAAQARPACGHGFAA